MLVGLDFDNTIVCYDKLFHRLAMEQGLLPESIAQTKSAVRDYLRSINKEDIWTEMQGVGYGPRIFDAEPYPGVQDFFEMCLANNIQIAIVSHKTKHPYLGPKYDLHEAAHTFLTKHGFYETDRTGLQAKQVNLELTKQAKMERIGVLGCDVFLDDLPEFLTEPAFPNKPQKCLFDPANVHFDNPDWIRINSWEDFGKRVLEMRGVQ